jgi:hypothetical protein
MAGEIINNIDVLNKSIERAYQILNEIAEKWDKKYINDLPNAAFAVVEKGYGEGKDKNARHLPHHNKNVKSATENSSVDLSHFRNALARVNQIKSVLGEESDSSLRKKAASHLEKHRSILNQDSGSFNDEELVIWKECEELFVNNVKPLLSD